jgi:Secretion system C-terminal sorting domain
MKTVLLILLTSSLLFAQDNNYDGKVYEPVPSLKFNRDLNGDGIPDNSLPQYNASINTNNPPSFSVNTLNFSLFWSSQAGAFSNCWDGAAGYFDGDTLLDIAGYTFNPNKFYIWEQVPDNPDSFALVAQFTKAEGGGYGPIVFGDTDGDGKIEIITADFSTFTRIYVYENDGDNTYVDKNTQSTMTHGTSFTKEYENLTYPGPAVRRVYWLPWTGYDGFFNTWSSSSSNGTFYIFKKDVQVGIEPAQNIPNEFRLYQNYPNPFNPSTIISYELKVTSFVTFNIFDITGKLINNLINKQQTPGRYSINFSSAGLPSGIYFYELNAGRLSDTKKMILLK